jgi:hypothetical protein
VREPIVSVLFGTFNRRPLLLKCVEAVRRSVGELPYEIVVCDGGSTDGSRQWLAEQIDVVMVGRRGLTGAVVAFNDCHALSRGRYLVTLNDDCEVQGDAIYQAVRLLEHDTQVGQVAFGYRRSVDDPKRGFIVNFLCPPKHHYANFGVIRRSLADEARRITGGMWSPAYYTYGADCELSCWVHRLGYAVRACPDLRVVDHEHVDGLRDANHLGGRAQRDGKLFWERWAKVPDMLMPRGAMPRMSERELGVLRELEARGPVAAPPSASRLEPVPEIRVLAARPADARALERVHPEPGHAPWRATTLPTKERVLHVHLWSADEPQTSLCQALMSLGEHSGHRRVDWTRLDTRRRGSPAVSQAVLAAAAEIKPTLVFMQLQQPGVLSGDDVRNIRAIAAEGAIIAHWTGDVGQQYGPGHWYHELGAACDLMLFSCMSHVEAYHADGMPNAAYLQIGYDEDRYYEGAEDRYGSGYTVVMLGQRYRPELIRLPLGTSDARLRIDLGERIRKLWNRRGGVFGSGWPSRPIPPAHSGDMYRASSLAVSVSLTNDLKRYSSDRLLRSMACGTPTLVKRFTDCDTWGLSDGVNCILFDTVKEFEQSARSWLHHDRRHELSAIGKAGAKLVREHHTWGVRMRELMAYVSALRGGEDAIERPW